MAFEPHTAYQHRYLSPMRAFQALPTTADDDYLAATRPLPPALRPFDTQSRHAAMQSHGDVHDAELLRQRGIPRSPRAFIAQHDVTT